MKGNREMFEIEARKYEDCDLSKNEDGSYKSDLTHTCFYWWCKSAQREGYKLVPTNPTKEHIHKFEEITVNGDDVRKYICIYCGFEKSESFND